MRTDTHSGGMLLADYQARSRATAVYPNLGANLTYPALGLGGEAAEVCEKALYGAPHEDIATELGDVLWYVAQLCTEAKLDMGRLGKLPGEFSAIPVGFVVPNRPLAAAARLSVSAGKVSELVKKAMRDDAGQLTPERAQRLSDALADVLLKSATVAHSCDVSLVAVAEANLAKLLSRQSRGVLHGSGDTR